MCNDLWFCVFVSLLAISQDVFGASTRQSTDIPMKFPGPTKDMTKFSAADDENIPEPCRGMTYCTIKPPDYPDAQIKELFKGTKPSLYANQPTLIVEGPTIVNRQGDPDEMDNCESTVTFEPLWKARDKRSNMWRDVIQAPDELFLQKVRLETCNDSEATCFAVFAPSTEYKTFCKQKHSTWKLLAIDKKTNKTEHFETELPICCSCHYKRKR